VAPTPALLTSVQAVQTLLLAHNPPAQVAVHVSLSHDEATAPVYVFSSVPVAQSAVASRTKRLLVAVVQVKEAPVLDPVTAVQAVHVPAFCCTLYQKKSTEYIIKREK
jgi:hypothetical protein